MTLEEYIRSSLTKAGDGEFLLDAWLDDDGKLHISFTDWLNNGPEFVVNGNVMEMIDSETKK